MKFFYIITIVFLVCYLSEHGEAKMISVVPHDYFDCPDPSRAITEVFSESILETGKWFPGIKQTLRFPSSGVIGNATITCIMIKHEDVSSKFNYKLRITGGVGEKSVTLMAEVTTLSKVVRKDLSLTVRVFTE